MLISVTGMPELDQALNSLKCRSLEALKNIWSFLYTKRPKEIFDQADDVSPYVLHGLQMQDSMLYTLKVLAKHNNYE